MNWECHLDQRVPFFQHGLDFNQLWDWLTNAFCARKGKLQDRKNGLHCTFLQDFFSCGQLNLLHEDISHLHVDLLLSAALSQHPIPCMFLLVWSKLVLILFMILTSGASSSAQNPTRLLGREASFRWLPRWSYGHNGYTSHYMFGILYLWRDYCGVARWHDLLATKDMGWLQGKRDVTLSDFMLCHMLMMYIQDLSWSQVVCILVFELRKFPGHLDIWTVHIRQWDGTCFFFIVHLSSQAPTGWLTWRVLLGCTCDVGHLETHQQTNIIQSWC